MGDPITDRFAIQDVMVRYAVGLDTRDFELIASCFTEDVVVAGFGGKDPVLGRDLWIVRVRKLLQRFGPTQHLIGNYFVEQRGDEVTMRSSVQATHVMADDPKATFTLWGTYHDVLVRQDGQWRIKSPRLESVTTENRRPL